MQNKNLSLSKFRDCLFPGGEEGAGGVLVAEEAFYQVKPSCILPHSWPDNHGPFSSTIIVYLFFPVSSGPWVSEPRTTRFQRRSWGWKSSPAHGLLHLLWSVFLLLSMSISMSINMDFCIFSGLFSFSWSWSCLFNNRSFDKTFPDIRVNAAVHSNNQVTRRKKSHCNIF